MSVVYNTATYNVLTNFSTFTMLVVKCSQHGCIQAHSKLHEMYWSGERAWKPGGHKFCEQGNNSLATYSGMEATVQKGELKSVIRLTLRARSCYRWVSVFSKQCLGNLMAISWCWGLLGTSSTRSRLKMSAGAVTDETCMYSKLYFETWKSRTPMPWPAESLAIALV